MELLKILKRLRTFTFMEMLIFVSLKSTEGFEQICPPGNFRCPDGNCYYSTSFCDGTDHCEDEYDEKYCNISDQLVSCPVADLPWFMCSDKTRCYPRHYRCNKYNNCKDGSDEMWCDSEPIRVQGAMDADKESITILKKKRVEQSTIKYGQHITKIVLALFSSNRLYLKPGSKTGDEMSSELSMQLLSKLALKKKISTYELSQYINAFLATCIDPRDFFGVNLVAELRKRVNQSNYTNPFTILTLCNARDNMLMEDVHKLQSIFDAQRRPLWAATQSIATLAMSCLYSHSSLQIDEMKFLDMVRELKRKQYRNGTVENLRTTALVVQALLATDTYQTDFNMRSAVKLMVDKVNSKDVTVQDIYYFLPVFNHMSLADINSDHCKKQTKTELEMLKSMEDFPEGQIPVPFSIYIGNEKHFVRTWKLRVPATHNFYQVLEIVSTLEPGYKITYSTSEGKPYVFSIGNFTEDAEVGKFWFIYTQPLSSQGNLTLLEKSPVDIPVKANEELILWYKSGHWYTSFGTPE